MIEVLHRCILVDELSSLAALSKYLIYWHVLERFTNIESQETLLLKQ